MFNKMLKRNYDLQKLEGYYNALELVLAKFDQAEKLGLSAEDVKNFVRGEVKAEMHNVKVELNELLQDDLYGKNPTTMTFNDEPTNAG